jgi:hypothetical protein
MEQRYRVGSTTTQNGVVRVTTIGFTRDGVGRTPDAFEFASQLAGLGEQAIEPQISDSRDDPSSRRVHGRSLAHGHGVE